MREASNRVRMRLILALVTVAFCAACQPSTEQSAALVEKGQAQVQAGDLIGALGSFREAIRLNSENIDARRALAALQLQEENFDSAQSQYLAIRERLPNDTDANLSLTEIALARYDTVGAEAFLQGPKTTDPASARTRAAIAALGFYKADIADDEAGRQRAIDDAKEVLREAPDNVTAHRIVIQSLMNGADPEAALPEIEAALMKRPRSLELNMMKLNILSKRFDGSAGTDQLKAMYHDFPDNSDVQTWLADWYLATGAPDETVAFLRDLAARHGDAPAEHQRIAAYVVDHYTAPEAAAELERLRQAYPAGPASDIYTVREADVRFGSGDKEQAIKILRDLLARDPAPAAPMVPLTKLARMLYETGNVDEAIELADKAISLGAGNLPAQLLRAELYMHEKDYHGAVTLLLQVQFAAPGNSDVLMRFGRALEADGSPDLANDAFAKAVQASSNGVQESIAFAEFLLRHGDRMVAEKVVQVALKAHPGDADLLALAAQKGFVLPAP